MISTKNTSSTSTKNSSSTKNSFSYILQEYVVGIFSKLLYYLPEISQSDKGSDQIGDLST